MFVKITKFKSGVYLSKLSMRLFCQTKLAMQVLLFVLTKGILMKYHCPIGLQKG